MPPAMFAGRRFLSPIAVLLIGLLATVIAALLVTRVERERQQARFSALADAVAGPIEGRLHEQRVLLRGVAALFHASGGVDRAEFSDYMSRLRLARNHPGVLGVGYAMRAESPRELEAAARRMRANGAPGFTPWPAADAFPSSAILFLEPPTPANRRALGFNMYGEPVRREAMTRALLTGGAALSGKVTLVQDQGSGNAAGFLLYVPVGREAGARAGTNAYAISGWAYSPLRAGELFGAALGRADLADAAVEVFDGAAAPENLLFRSAEYPGDVSLRGERRVNFAGRAWTVRVAAQPGFFADAPLSLGAAVLSGGAFISLLLSILALQQARAATRTEEEVRRATADLRRANDELVAAGRAREEAEAQVRQMQKVEAIGQLTGGIAHDFNNMLAVVMGNLDLAERRAGDTDRVRRALAAAKEGATRAAELTRRLLAFGRQQALEPRLIDANRLVGGMSELLRRSLGETVRLETVLAGGLWAVEADPGQLENAVLNLAINGRDAMPEGGALTVETANCRLDDAYAARHEAVAPGQYVLIAVTDSGTGMPADVASKALDPFFTTKEVGRGTGLGLSQVFGFVKQSGGHLKIYSEVGEGTTVKIYLPRAHGVAAAPEAVAERAEPPRGRPEELILVTEDETGVRLTTVDTLRELGYTVVHAGGGAEALELLDRHGDIALLLTDVVMPGMNGRELAKQAQARRPGLRVLFTTGYTPNAIVHEGRLDRDVSLVTKPFTTDQLAAKVRAELDRP